MHAVAGLAVFQLSQNATASALVGSDRDSRAGAQLPGRLPSSCREGGALLVVVVGVLVVVLP